MAWRAGQTFKCPNFNCGCELRVIAEPQDRRGPPQPPVCGCGTPMKRWPESAVGSDQYDDV